MRIVASSLIVLALSFVSTVARAADDDARAIVDKSIEVLGGADKLAKHNATTFTEKGTYYGMGDGLPYTGNYSMQWPDQFRMEIEGVFTIVRDGDKGWTKSAGGVAEMQADQIAAQKQDHSAGYMSTLLPLRDKAFTLKTLPDGEVEKRPARVVQASRDGYPEVTLFFDKETNLLAKAAHKTKAAEEGYKEMGMEVFFSDYKEVDGVKVAHKTVMKREGKVYIDSELTAYKAEGKLDAKTFAKPE